MSRRQGGMISALLGSEKAGRGDELLMTSGIGQQGAGTAGRCEAGSRGNGIDSSFDWDYFSPISVSLEGFAIRGSSTFISFSDIEKMSMSARSKPVFCKAYQILLSRD